MKTNYPITQHLARMVLAVAIALGAVTSFGQQSSKPKNTAQVIDLRAEYDLWPSDAKLRLQDVFTVAEAKARYPDLWRRATESKDKLTDAQVMSMTLFEAAHTAALWRNADLLEVGDPTLPHGKLLGSRNTIVWPLGGYAITRPLEYAGGIIEGQGNGVGNIDYGGRNGHTEIEPWLDRWAGGKHVTVLRSANGGSNNVYAYSEATILRNFRINGRSTGWHNPERAITGINCWDMGEGSDVTDIFVYLCDTGINIVRGTPFTCSGVLSLFQNNCAGLAITGGGTISIQTLSGDDNGRLVHSRAGYGRPASCGLWIGAVKDEFAITPARIWKPNTWELDGWTRLNIGFYSLATGNVFKDALFTVKPDVNTSHITVGDLRGFCGDNQQLVLRDRVNREAWAFDNGWSSGIQEFRWTSIGGGNLESWPTQAPRIDYPFTGPQLGYLKGDPVTGRPVGAFDRVNGLPSWSDVTGSSAAPVAPPTTCTYTYSAWSACSNGTQTRTVVSSTPAGCTGTPVLSQACTTTTTPPSGTALYTSPGAVNIADGNYSLDIPDITIRRIVLHGYVLTGAPNWSAFAVPPGPSSTAYISVHPDGTWNTPAGRCTVTTSGTTTTITLPAPMLISRLGTWLGNGGALRYTATRLELFAQ